MKNIRVIKMDLIILAKSCRCDVVVHGCNCFCTMGSGVAKALVNNFPQILDTDKKTKVGDETKLGTYSETTFEITNVDNATLLDPNHLIDTRTLTIINAYTQYDYGYDGICRFSYDAFEKILKDLNIKFKGKVLAMPWIGTGLAGGSKEKVLNIIQDNLTDCQVLICEL